MNRSDRRKKNTKKVHGKQKEKTLNLYLSPDEFRLRQNGAPSGLEKRGLDASIYHKTKKPTEGTQ
ncbi:hypothetical protein LBK6_01810 [Leptospira borgpetersenii serovar Hardjo]|nr:hypothetical protein LBK6_01810 [Leptospira borgpetersenii serovar Hardjo]AWV69084.1 hypothetical protein B9T54_01955 [Leptospira borgpetersenii serovar Hardjo-bovis]MBE8434627.1 hypothetical protein [Leptospira borgpetersenii serovar Tarassovi]TQE50946.1 hypothetical protein FFZ95_16425 [Leptospira borgpetersenii]AMX60407.1 hypothetical protein LBK9_01810 [Leptospira borgpetersenii serovar Hardjo]